MRRNNRNLKAREVYADIIDLPHHRSATHPPLSASARAAQFAPFAALSGYDAMVKETARETEQKKSLSEEEMRVLNQKLLFLQQEIAAGQRPEVRINCFVPDQRKAGGRYEIISGKEKNTGQTVKHWLSGRYSW